jgi:7-cyano-7-deazaguanine synthase
MPPSCCFPAGRTSSVCLAWALDRYPRVETVGFDYGQRHAVELQARQAVRARMAAAFPSGPCGWATTTCWTCAASAPWPSRALTADRAIEMTAKGLPSTFVPGRNLVFFVYAAALADRRGLPALVGGMCETDFSGYPDCRRDTLDAMQTALNLGMAQDFVIETPLMRLTKAETWALTKGLGGEPAGRSGRRRDSHTCYLGDREHRHPWGYGCGTCPACELRPRLRGLDAGPG